MSMYKSILSAFVGAIILLLAMSASTRPAMAQGPAGYYDVMIAKFGTQVWRYPTGENLTGVHEVLMQGPGGRAWVPIHAINARGTGLGFVSVQQYGRTNTGDKLYFRYMAVYPSAPPSSGGLPGSGTGPGGLGGGGSSRGGSPPPNNCSGVSTQAKPCAPTRKQPLYQSYQAQPPYRYPRTPVRRGG